jgi:hypothetical protein
MTLHAREDVMAASPEPPAEAGDDRTRHEENDEKAEHMVPVRQSAAADCVSRQEMAEQANHEQDNAEPHAKGLGWQVGLRGSMELPTNIDRPAYPQ